MPPNNSDCLSLRTTQFFFMAACCSAVMPGMELVDEEPFPHEARSMATAAARMVKMDSFMGWLNEVSDDFMVLF